MAVGGSRPIYEQTFYRCTAQEVYIESHFYTTVLLILVAR